MTKDIGITILEVDTFIRKFDRSAFLICDYFQAVALPACLPDRQTDRQMKTPFYQPASQKEKA